VKTQKVPCALCKRVLSQMSRHLKQGHHDIKEVAEVLVKSKAERHLGLDRIRNRGIFRHNVEVLKSGTGMLYVARRMEGTTHIAEDYVPCPFCMSFIMRTELWRHCATCEHKPLVVPDRSYVATGLILLEGALTSIGAAIDPALKEQVINKMRLDRLTSVVKADDLITRYGTTQLRKKGPKAVYEISQRMRHLARLKERLQEGIASDVPVPLTDFIKPDKFDAVIAGVEKEFGLFVDKVFDICMGLKLAYL